MGRNQLLLSAAVLLVAVLGANAEERGTKEKPRLVAPGITMAPGLPKAEQAKSIKAEPKVETSKSQQTTYGERISPEPPVEAKIDEPKPSAPPVAVNARPQPDPNAVGRPVAASPAAVQQQPAQAAQPVQSQQKVVTAPEPARGAAQPKQAARELRVGDRIPDDVRLYDGPPQRQRVVVYRGRELRVGDRVPDDLMMYVRPR